MKKLFAILLTACAVGLSGGVFAEEKAVTAESPAVTAPAAAPAAAAEAPAAATPVPNKGDTAWMIVATALVILMTIPGLALFYGGLVRAKNMLSVLMQVFVIFSVMVTLWVIYGYSLADRKSVV